MTSPLLRRFSYLVTGVVAAALLAGPGTGPAPDATAAASATPVDSTRLGSDSDPVRVRKSYPVVASARIGTVQVGKKIRIVGSVTTRHRKRPIMLAERKKHHKWKVIARKKSNRVGAYAFKIPAGRKAKVRVFRVETKRFHGLRGGTTRALKIRVVKAPPTAPTNFDAPEYLPAGYVGAGSTTYGPGWALFAGGSRWNPCRTIRWAYNPTGEKYAALPDMQRAFARLAGISGLRFRYVGATSWRFLGNLQDPAFPSSTADIAVGWANDRELPTLAGNTVGYGGWSGPEVRGADVQYRISRGYLILDNGATLQPGFDQVGWGSVSMHEIMHSLGLDHAGEPVQMMYPELTANNVNPGAGDITGLGKVGSASGCLN
jgi:hypothetical protein